MAKIRFLSFWVSWAGLIGFLLVLNALSAASAEVINVGYTGP